MQTFSRETEIADRRFAKSFILWKENCVSFYERISLNDKPWQRQLETTSLYLSIRRKYENMWRDMIAYTRKRHLKNMSLTNQHEEIFWRNPSSSYEKQDLEILKMTGYILGNSFKPKLSFNFRAVNRWIPNFDWSPNAFNIIETWTLSHTTDIQASWKHRDQKYICTSLYNFVNFLIFFVEECPNLTQDMLHIHSENNCHTLRKLSIISMSTE